MRPGAIWGANCNFAPPADGSMPECQDLKVRKEVWDSGPTITSAWFPTPEEIKLINEGRPVYLTTWSHGMPPTALWVTPDEESQIGDLGSTEQKPDVEAGD